MFGWVEQFKREIEGFVVVGKKAFGWRPSSPQGTDVYWGVCPHCKRNDGYLNLGRGHWFLCHRHRVRWCAGDNLFSTWRHETLADWRDNFARIGEYAVLESKDVYVGKHEERGGDRQ